MNGLPILTVAGIRAVEARHAHEGLMERAGAAAAAVASELVAGRRGPVWIVAGPGNNGGDGFVVARLLSRSFHDVVTVFTGDAARLPTDAAAAFAALRSAGVAVLEALPDGRPALIVDALFGIGLTRAPDVQIAALIDAINARGAPVLALDIPSGIGADTGAAFAPAIRADATATFIALKPGLSTGDGLEHAGVVTLHTLGTMLVDADAPGRRLDWPTLARTLPPPLRRTARNAHKGTFGTLAIVGGADGMVGAPLLSGRAALKLGAGKVRVGFAASASPAVDWGTPELMLRDAAFALATPCDALVVGPGLGTDDAAGAVIAHALALDVPLVIDADALNVIATDGALRERLRTRAAATVITPHPAEAGRLLNTSAAAVGSDRPGAAQTLARDLHAHVVLKGAGTVVVDRDGGYAINGSGGPALATAGTGDVLAGMLGALLAQGVEARDAARFAVCLHGAAADALVEQGRGPVGLLASELADAARDLVNRARVTSAD